MERENYFDESLYFPSGLNFCCTLYLRYFKQFKKIFEYLNVVIHSNELYKITLYEAPKFSWTTCIIIRVYKKVRNLKHENIFAVFMNL